MPAFSGLIGTQRAHDIGGMLAVDLRHVVDRGKGRFVARDVVAAGAHRALGSSRVGIAAGLGGYGSSRRERPRGAGNIKEVENSHGAAAR
jgi:hypothetical protein